MRAHFVEVHVKPECVDAFKAATEANARGSIQEPLVARFDFYQLHDDPNRFMVVEVFRSDDGPAAHKETEHYRIWKETVEDMMAKPRQAARYANVCPDDASFDNPAGDF
jgi:(4S)-4-hydroxy-5-phosphonooxypentane-2,3-dione isomerase